MTVNIDGSEKGKEFFNKIKSLADKADRILEEVDANGSFKLMQEFVDTVYFYECNNQIPIELNEFGLSVWRHKDNRNLFAQRQYKWVDRIIVLDETYGRKVVDDLLFSHFDFDDWIPVTIEEFSKVVFNYNEIYK